tara:strand:- start:92 stop:337 length:246 start_codon:yes stop_codon:yes gene_type:complete
MLRGKLMTELQRLKNKINTDDLIMTVFGFDTEDKEWDYFNLTSGVNYILDKVGVSDKHKDWEEIWNYVFEQAYEITDNAVS